MIELGAKAPTGSAALGCQLLILHLCLFVTRALGVGPTVEHDPQNKRVTLSDAGHNLVLRLNYDGKCILDQVNAGGRQVVNGEVNSTAGGGVFSAIKLGDQWFDSRTCISTPQVNTTSNT